MKPQTIPGGLSAPDAGPLVTAALPRQAWDALGAEARALLTINAGPQRRGGFVARIGDAGWNAITGAVGPRTEGTRLYRIPLDLLPVGCAFTIQPQSARTIVEVGDVSFWLDAGVDAEVRRAELVIFERVPKDALSEVLALCAHWTPGDLR